MLKSVEAICHRTNPYRAFAFLPANKGAKSHALAYYLQKEYYYNRTGYYFTECLEV